ncbi:MAG: alanine/glycine:cation symporter family protein [Candidatus Gastranaerophilales bacterium]|nr:alanine/glycine:cation symporter family protein [Candidatus Gastranaerophilales bacterium]
MLSKRVILFLAALLFQAQSAFGMSIDKQIDKFFTPVSDVFSEFIFYPITIGGTSVPITILWLLAAGVVTTFYLRGISLWGFVHSIKLVTAKNPAFSENNNDEDGEVSPLQALITALSGTVGLGSIAGVAISISIGGPGAVFWIFVGALLGMTLKFCEAVLAIKYRRFNEDGSVSGGPMHYIAHGLTRKNLRWFGQPLALIFAILTIPAALGGGNMLQVNQATQQVIAVTGAQNSIFYNNAWVCGLLTAIAVGMIIMGGIKGIAKAAEKLVPLMCFLYLFLALAVILLNIPALPSTLFTILKEAFNPSAIYGGIAGVIIIGLRRSIQTNEAGAGSAPIAYAASKTKEPVSQGFIALLEPFITACVCALTAATIIITNAYKNVPQGLSGVELTSGAFSSVLSFSPYILAVVIFLFAFTTIISWAYYGQKGWTYMFGEGKKRIITYQLIFLLFTVVGSSMNLGSIINLTDASMLAMAIPNLIAVYILLPEIKSDLIEYCKKHSVALKLNKMWFKEELVLVAQTEEINTDNLSNV